MKKNDVCVLVLRVLFLVVIFFNLSQFDPDVVDIQSPSTSYGFYVSLFMFVFCELLFDVLFSVIDRIWSRHKSAPSEEVSE